MHSTTIGLDIAKHVFQVHGVDASGAIVIRQKLRRAEVLAFFETPVNFSAVRRVRMEKPGRLAHKGWSR